MEREQEMVRLLSEQNRSLQDKKNAVINTAFFY